MCKKVEQAKLASQRPEFQTLEAFQERMAQLESEKFALAKQTNELENVNSSHEHEISVLKRKDANLDEEIEAMDAKYELM